MKTSRRKNKKGLRRGYTTGTCAAAATKAAILCLMRQFRVDDVRIHLPGGEPVNFKVHSCSFTPGWAKCSIIKDGGDDPDVTHGAEIVAEVTRNELKKNLILGGKGVGVVTKPGLGLEIGAPAINPVPMVMIEDALASGGDPNFGYTATISVPAGEKLARKTLNPRLGIIGGISILGTRGTVIPYSTDAYKHCVTQSISVAAALGLEEIVLTTGGRTEKAAQRIIPMREEGFIRMGDFVGHAVKKAKMAKRKKVFLCAMLGKMSKIACGHLQTHANRSHLKMEIPAQTAKAVGVPDGIVEQIKIANTARHVFELIPKSSIKKYSNAICSQAAANCFELAKGKIKVEAILVDYEGNEIGRSGNT